MPTLQLKVAPLLNPAHYRALAHALTRITAQHLGKREEVAAATGEFALCYPAHAPVRLAVPTR